MRETLRPLVAAAGLFLLSSACGDDCAGIASCIPEIAVTISLSASPDGGPIPDAVVQVSSAIEASVPCNTQTGQTTCTVLGGGGTYTLVIGAPGYRSATRTVSVQSRNGECGCVIVATQHLDVSLLRASS